MTIEIEKWWRCHECGWPIHPVLWQFFDSDRCEGCDEYRPEIDRHYYRVTVTVGDPEPPDPFEDYPYDERHIQYDI